MAIIEFHFSKPTTIIGEAIILRTGGDYSHSWIVIDGTMYNPLPVWSKSHNPPIYTGDIIYHLEVDLIRFYEAHMYCEEWVGTQYDFLGILGWLIGVGRLENSNQTYCFEFCHDVLEIFTNKKLDHNLISARHLINELSSANAKLIKA